MVVMATKWYTSLPQLRKDRQSHAKAGLVFDSLDLPDAADGSSKEDVDE
jgi:hypothetical protein